VAKVLERIRRKNVTVVLDDKAREFLIEKGFDPQYGARPMRRSIEKHLEDPLAEEILRGTLIEGEPVTVTADQDKLVFKQRDQRDQAAEGALSS
jgi:ATP-dependent Clp protease ATP-binding subunit ClpC